MLLEHPQAQRSRAYAPPLSTWSPEVELLTSILDAVRVSGVMAVNAQGARVEPPKPSPRPRTALERVRTNQALREHEALVARLTALREEGAPTMTDVAEAVVEVRHGKVESQDGERKES